MLAVNRQYLAPTRAEAAKGLWPCEHMIHPHTVLYRFVDTTRTSPEAGADGAWWFEYEHFQTIKHFASRQGYSLGYSARLFAAILYEWSEVNAVVRAEAVAPLAAWKGRGKQVIVGKDRPLFHPEIDARDLNRTPSSLLTGAGGPLISKMTPLQGPNEVYQLYVPGLGRPYHKFPSYFKYLGHEPISTG